jgi:predicted NBD/HSP70 family sugar kinase
MKKTVQSLIEAMDTLPKKKLMRTLISAEQISIPDLARNAKMSVPTATKIVNELLEKHFLVELGKHDNGLGRLPMMYGLNPACGYFLGVDPCHNALNLCLTDFAGEVKDIRMGIPFHLNNTPQDFDELCKLTKAYIQEKGLDDGSLFKACVNISGRVSPRIGCSYSTYAFEDNLADSFTKRLGVSTHIDNDTRSMTYGEYTKGGAVGAQNALFVNVSWGIGMGIIVNGSLYTGKSGFSGEIGHMPYFNNEILCHCGKKGCLETEVSGSALLRIVNEHLANGEQSLLSKKRAEGELTLYDILDALDKEDTLCIDCISQMGEKLGRFLSGMINIFNPEKLIIGGELSRDGGYITQTVRTAIKKYALHLVSDDSVVETSKLQEKAGVIGAAMIARSKLFTNDYL